VVSEQHHVELGVGSNTAAATIERSVRIIHSYDDDGEEFIIVLTPFNSLLTLCILHSSVIHRIIIFILYIQDGLLQIYGRALASQAK